MQDLFRSFWWMVFPLSWFVFDGYHRWLADRARRDAVELLKTYAKSGREPPAELLARLDAR
ncbi:hypothetical protein PMI01_03956 [Caulobacter sp. AP07]|uniref:hypothetical protein n=1 Tax=Caulobacter sp. AP07 TaxID=1144304 RepID=UPI000272208E|nr:hypothetical protein [Caulobacter sp. AP07]EJL27184.1 hypothetical protein PMI01_03956 [Caulobacter sp. AP07]